MNYFKYSCRFEVPNYSLRPPDNSFRPSIYSFRLPKYSFRPPDYSFRPPIYRFSVYIYRDFGSGFGFGLPCQSHGGSQACSSNLCLNFRMGISVRVQPSASHPNDIEDRYDFEPQARISSSSSAFNGPRGFHTPGIVDFMLQAWISCSGRDSRHGFHGAGMDFMLWAWISCWRYGFHAPGVDCMLQAWISWYRHGYPCLRLEIHA